ncbi:MAG: methyltransferase domain-containing protein [Flavobacterium sp.]
MNRFDSTYWENRYITGETGWDAGSVTTPIKEYIDQLTDTSQKILVPGAGNGHEVVYLLEKGFTEVFVVDIAPTPLENLKKRVPELPNEQLILGDYFELDDTFDLIIEQTFYCALDPSLRAAYAQKCFELLKPGGKIAGVYFDFPLTEQGPPFGGSHEEYLSLFSSFFSIKTLERCYNSIAPRAERELFFIFEKK